MDDKKKKYLRNWAKAGWDTGHSMDPDDFDEFKHICKDDGFDVTRSDFDYYWECFENCRSEAYN